MKKFITGAVVMAALITAAVVLTGGSSSAASSDPATFAKQLNDHLYLGDSGWAYDRLHPEQRKLVSYSDFDSCTQADRLMSLAFGANTSHYRVARAITGRTVWAGVPDSLAVEKAVLVTIYVVNIVHPGKPDVSTEHVYLTKAGLRWAMPANEIIQLSKGKCA